MQLENKKIIFCEAEYKSDSRKVLKQAIKIFKEKLKAELIEAFEKTGRKTYEDNNIRIICKMAQ